MTGLAITSLSSGGVITNYHCTSRCGHCLYNCGPHRSRTYLSADLAEDIFQRIARMGCRSVHIGGGEPLLVPTELLLVLDSAGKAGVGIDYVETNSAWFTDAGKAETLLETLLRSGVHSLLISISPFHNAHVPFNRVRGVIEACRRTGMQVFPWVNAFVRDLSRLDTSRPHGMEDFTAAFGAGYLRRIPDRYWIHLGGRALDTFRAVYPQYPPEQIVTRSSLSCLRALTDTSHFHIDLYGNYVPGLCAGLAIALEDLGGPLPSGKYPLLDRLAATGIGGLYELACRNYGYIPTKALFLNHCDLCTDIRKFLLKQDAESFPELGPVEFYA